MHCYKSFFSILSRSTTNSCNARKQIYEVTKCCTFAKNSNLLSRLSGSGTVRLCTIAQDLSDDVPLISESNLDSVVSNVKSNATKYSNDQILKLFASSKRLTGTDAEKQALLSLLEAECIHRARHWDVETFVDFFKQYRAIGFAKDSKFVVYALRRRSKYIFNHCSLSVILDFLSLVYGTGAGRRAQFNKYDLEHVLHEHLNELRPDQVEMFVDLLSSTGKNLRDLRLKETLCDWFVKENAAMSADFVRKFFSLFRGHDSTGSLSISPSLVRALKAVEHRLSDEFDLNCLAVIASTCSRKIILDEGVLEKIASKLVHCLHEAATTVDLRDIEAIVEALASLGYNLKTRDLYSEVVKQMSEKPLYSRLREQPRVLCRILAHLSFVNVYPYKLISLNFSKDCLARGYKSLCKFNVPTEIRLLAGGLRVERPDYRGCKIGFNLVRHCVRKSRLSFPKILEKCKSVEIGDDDDDPPKVLGPYNRVLYSARNLLNRIFDSVECTRVCFVLQHSTKANILFCTNKAKQPQKLPSHARSNLSLKHQDLMTDSNNLDYYVVVFRSKNVFTDYEPILIGEEIAKCRQVKSLGFETLALTQHGWFEVSAEERKTLLRKALVEQGIDLTEIPVV